MENTLNTTTFVSSVYKLKTTNNTNFSNKNLFVYRSDTEKNNPVVSLTYDVIFNKDYNYKVHETNERYPIQGLIIKDQDINIKNVI